MQNSKAISNSPFFFNQLNRFKINQNKQAFLEKDTKLNRLLVDAVAFSVVGYLTGTALSIFFKKRMIPQNIGFGMGLGFALHYNGQVTDLFVMTIGQQDIIEQKMAIAKIYCK